MISSFDSSTPIFQSVDSFCFAVTVKKLFDVIELAENMASDGKIKVSRILSP